MIGCPPWQTLSVSAALALGVESAATLKTTAQKPTRALFQTASHLFMSSSQVVQWRRERAPSQDTPAGDHTRQGVMNVRVSRAGQLQQGFAIGEMGSIDQFALQKFWTAHVRFEKADIQYLPLLRVDLRNVLNKRVHLPLDVVPPWSGCSFFMRDRWARLIFTGSSQPLSDGGEAARPWPH